MGVGKCGAGWPAAQTSWVTEWAVSWADGDATAGPGTVCEPEADRRLQIQLSETPPPYLTIVVDHDEHRVVWAGPGRSAETLGSLF